MNTKHIKNCNINSNVGIPKAQKDESYCDCFEKKLLRLTKSELIELLAKIKRFTESEIWSSHTFTDNFGMTPEQEENVNKLLVRVNNRASSEILEMIDTYLNNIEYL